ncbi:MAG: hypothetical protein K2J80_13610 [Oscillospiraceae bacterium]|nr:hypothetical protein [Oscillospiraceae bacterium]
MDINFVNTPKKYEDKADEVISELFGLLGELLTVQERAALRFQRLEQKSLPYMEKCAKHTEIFDKCIAEYAEVIKDRCTENEMAHKHPGSMGQTPEYFYIKGEYTVDFTMKTPNTATVITHFHKENFDEKHKFVLVFVDGTWLVDAVYSGFEGEHKWYHTEI